MRIISILFCIFQQI
ncbi:hypothetical protein HU200_029116 [Digitaria exilis]|uniref:Uncharacterized protein n=1 Tax=Digitaria exilis TaxID=1010633 RepID=A0A835BU75_9POAL|nr:hypothetical protein HU200_029116 [Digitaria exilis]